MATPYTPYAVPARRTLTSEQGRNSESPQARRIVPVNGKFKVVTERDERAFLNRRRLLLQKQTQPRASDARQVFSPAGAFPLVHPEPPFPPLPSRRRRGARVTWDEQVRVVNVIHSNQDRMAQRAYLIALQHAKELRKANAPDELIDAFFEMEERAVKIFRKAEPSEVRSQVKGLVRRRLATHKVSQNERFLKALMSMGHDILRLTEPRPQQQDPSSRPSATQPSIKWTPPTQTSPPPSAAPAQPQGFNIVSPTRVRVFIPWWFAKECADRSAGCDADVVGRPNDYAEAECNYSDLQAMVLAIVDSP